MTPEALEKAALALPGADISIKWGADRVYTVGGKMFAATYRASTSLSMKMTDILSALDAGEVSGWLTTAHELAAEKLPGKQRVALGLAA